MTRYFNCNGALEDCGRAESGRFFILNRRSSRTMSSADKMTPEQLTRYSRHFILPEIGEEGQKKLLRARVLLIGAGGLGSPLGLYLAAAGVGTIGIVDFYTVDLSNLQRQILHTNADVGKPKIDSAEKRIKAMNPDTQVEKYPVRLTSDN